MTKIYGEGDVQVGALQNASFSINKGEFVLVIGASGSGKSTLLNMMGLLDRPTKGKVFIDGVDTSTLNDNQISAFRNQKLGFIFQFANLLADLTVLENVTLPRQIQGSNGTAIADAKKLLTTVGLENQMYNRANKISGGQAQRAAIARGLVNHPSIVLADEPTGNLDSVTAETIVQLLKSMSRKLRSRHARLGKAELSLTPLIDTALTLLIIFMVSTSVPIDEGLDIKLPQTASTPKVAEGDSVTIALDKKGKVSIEGKVTTFDELGKKLRAQMIKKSTGLVILKGDAKSYLEHIIKIMDIAKSNGATKFAIATTKK